MPVRQRYFSRFEVPPTDRYAVRLLLAETWQAFLGGLEQSEWIEFASRANAWFNDKSEQSHSVAKRWEDGQDLLLFKGLKSNNRLSHIREYLYTAIPGENRLVGPYRERADLYFRAQAQFLWEAATGARQPADNDVQDLEQLVHVGEPAFLLTEDKRLLERVARTKSRQRFWVLSTAEFLDWPLPCGLPHGARAIRRANHVGNTGRRVATHAGSL
jgi:hypothetical protein